ncbi:hypothetical protein [Microbispora sp. KK1-11]|uniref:hypothetical protein n=1 Tax=Microbispora sp. KK1-11 TaxID=2053005 RepID=UPI0011599A57|nr:hypothetical protein [Microbispora sp. KK1-11]TQS22294.1 hypothetical protein FLW16_38415 [Microbispora sp. KK1-11]
MLFQQRMKNQSTCCSICCIDQKMAPQELATIESYAKVLPEFHGRGFPLRSGQAAGLSGRWKHRLHRRRAVRHQVGDSLRENHYCTLELAFADGLWKQRKSFR